MKKICATPQLDCRVPYNKGCKSACTALHCTNIKTNNQILRISLIITFTKCQTLEKMGKQIKKCEMNKNAKTVEIRMKKKIVLTSRYFSRLQGFVSPQLICNSLLDVDANIERSTQSSKNQKHTEQENGSAGIIWNNLLWRKLTKTCNSY